MKKIPLKIYYLMAVSIGFTPLTYCVESTGAAEMRSSAQISTPTHQFLSQIGRIQQEPAYPLSTQQEEYRQKNLAYIKNQILDFLDARAKDYKDDHDLFMGYKKILKIMSFMGYKKIVEEERESGIPNWIFKQYNGNLEETAKYCKFKASQFKKLINSSLKSYKDFNEMQSIEEIFFSCFDSVLYGMSFRFFHQTISNFYLDDKRNRKEKLAEEYIALNHYSEFMPFVLSSEGRITASEIIDYPSTKPGTTYFPAEDEDSAIKSSDTNSLMLRTMRECLPFLDPKTFSFSKNRSNYYEQKINVNMNNSIMKQALFHHYLSKLCGYREGEINPKLFEKAEEFTNEFKKIPMQFLAYAQEAVDYLSGKSEIILDTDTQWEKILERFFDREKNLDLVFKETKLYKQFDKKIEVEKKNAKKKIIK